MGGQLRVCSRLGAGSTFTFTARFRSVPSVHPSAAPHGTHCLQPSSLACPHTTLSPCTTAPLIGFSPSPPLSSSPPHTSHLPSTSSITPKPSFSPSPAAAAAAAAVAADQSCTTFLSTPHCARTSHPATTTTFSRPTAAPLTLSASPAAPHAEPLPSLSTTHSCDPNGTATMHPHPHSLPQAVQPAAVQAAAYSAALVVQGSVSAAALGARAPAPLVREPGHSKPHTPPPGCTPGSAALSPAPAASPSSACAAPLPGSQQRAGGGARSSKDSSAGGGQVLLRKPVEGRSEETAGDAGAQGRGGRAGTGGGRAAEGSGGVEVLSGMRILLAEDNVVNQKVALHLLRRAGAVVTVVGDGRAAVDAVTACHDAFDVVLMDIQMPVMDGMEATRTIRQWEQQPLALPDTAPNPPCQVPQLRQPQNKRHMVIVGLTAHAMQGYKEKCFIAGMDGYDTKPFQLHTLACTIQSAIASVRQLE
ncbi:hypothetical protein CLOM_g16518 [Closterium sp. NIES-68]|nr:hypothetical protein CLOM_g16518 [Closterium sp. NIES-68]GJP70884.1 hypothetical protein CLOP_g1776 [Closterium sp. NIES-67]